MKSFLEHLSELAIHAPQAPIEKTQHNLKEPETVDEINKHLSLVTSKGFHGLFDALHSVKKVLSMYNIEIPAIEFPNKVKGSIKIDIGQFKTSGESLNNVVPVFGNKDEHHTFTFSYKIKDGLYDVSAKVNNK